MRIEAHQKAMEFGQKSRADNAQKAQELAIRTKGLNVRFFEEAAECVIEGRRTLMWTYVLAYYLDSSGIRKQKQRFQMLELQLWQMEALTDRLQEAVERDVEALSATILRMKFLPMIAALSKSAEILF
jgi:hypothetical protein